MRVLFKTLVRLAVIALALTAYLQLVVARWGEEGDANIGAGLLAFLGLVVLAFVWALVDGRRGGFASAAVVWAVVAAGLSVGWLLVLAVTQSDASMTVREMVLADLSLVPFVFLLVLVPAVAGAAIGAALGGSTRHSAA